MAENTSSGGAGYEAINPARQDFAWQVASQQAVQASRSDATGPAGVVGGQATSQGVISPGNGPDAAMGWGGFGQAINKLIEPRVAAAQKEEFWKGVTAARAGKAVTEAVEEDGPLSKIFGPSGYTQGVQFYTSQDKIARYNQDLIEKADDYAKLTPAELGATLNEEAIKYETGDPTTDAMVHQSWIEGTAPMLAVVNKTRFAQQQEAAVGAFTSSMQSSASQLQALGSHLARGTASKEDMLGGQMNLVNAWRQPPGMTKENYRKVLPGLARSYADQGNFHALDVMQQSGILGFLTVDEATKLGDYTEKKATAGVEAYRRTKAVELSDMRASLKAGAMVPAEFDQKLSDMQAEFTALTGNKQPLLKTSERENTLTEGRGNWWEAQEQLVRDSRVAAAKATTQQEKDLAEAKDLTDINAQMTIGNLGEYVRLGGNSSLVAQSFDKAYNGYNLEERAQLLTSNYKNSDYVDPNVKAKLQSGLRAVSSGEGYSPSFGQTYKEWTTLNATTQGQATAAAYYSTEQQVRLNRFDSLVRQQIDAPIAFKLAFQDPLTDAVDWTKSHGMDKTVRNVVVDKYDRWFSDDTNLSEGSRNLVAGLVMKNVSLALQNTGLTPEQATYQALNNLKANGLETYGGEAWMKTLNQRPLTEYITHGKPVGDTKVYAAANPKHLSQVFSDVMAAGLKKSGLDKADSMQVLRLPDLNGVAQFAVIGANKEGNQVPYQFSSKDLSEAYDKKIKSYVKPDNALFPPKKFTYLGEQDAKGKPVAERNLYR